MNGMTAAITRALHGVRDCYGGCDVMLGEIFELHDVPRCQRDAADIVRSLAADPQMLSAMARALYYSGADAALVLAALTGHDARA